MQHRLDEARSHRPFANDAHVRGDRLASGSQHRRVDAVIGLRFAQHQAHRDDGARDRPQIADQSRLHGAVHGQAHHRRRDDQPHAERRAQIRQRRHLVFLEIALEVVVLGEGQDRRIVRQIAVHDAQSARAGKAVQRIDDGPQHAVDQRDHAELRQKSGRAASQHRHRHQMEADGRQQLIPRQHHCFEHVGTAHDAADPYEKGKEKEKENKSLFSDLLLEFDSFPVRLHCSSCKRAGSAV